MNRFLGLACLTLIVGCGTSNGPEMGATQDLATPNDLAMATVNDLTSAPGADLTPAPAADLATPPGGDLAKGPMTWTVHIGTQGAFAFAPATLTIAAGDTVHWVWDSGGHSVTSGDGAIDNKFCSPNDMNCGAGATSASGATYDHKFPAAGSFPYFCVPHVGAGMKGTITVQ